MPAPITIYGTKDEQKVNIGVHLRGTSRRATGARYVTARNGMGGTGSAGAIAAAR
jgi:hypothetical protein